MLRGKSASSAVAHIRSYAASRYGRSTGAVQGIQPPRNPIRKTRSSFLGARRWIVQRDQREADEPVARGTAIIRHPVVVIAEAGGNEIEVVEAEYRKKEARIQQLGTDTVLILIGITSGTSHQPLAQPGEPAPQNFLDVRVALILGQWFMTGTALDRPAGIQPAAGDPQLRRGDRPPTPRRDHHRIDVAAHVGNAGRFVAKALREPRENFWRLHHVRVRRDKKPDIFRLRG